MKLPLRVDGCLSVLIVDADGCLVAECPDIDEAREIVRCVNAHDGLVAALREIESIFYQDNADTEHDVCRIGRIAKAALAAAGEEA